MKVQTLGLLGHFSTMNPPGPFSPLQGAKSRELEPFPGAPRRSCASSCSSSRPLRLAARTRARRGASRCAESPGRCLLWLRAHEPAQRGRFPTGALAAAVPALPAEEQPLPPARTTPAGTGSSPRGGFRGITLRKRGQTRGPGGTFSSARGALSLQPPDPSLHHLIRLRDKSCAHTQPCPAQEHTIFAAHIRKKDVSRSCSPLLLNRPRQLQRLRVKMSITLTRLLGKTKSARARHSWAPGTGAGSNNESLSDETNPAESCHSRAKLSLRRGRGRSPADASGAALA